jgi:TRAP-type uncharacterized transport system fused permease subunit
MEGDIDQSKRFRHLPKYMERILTFLMLVYSLYFLYAAGFKPLPGIEHRFIHIAGGVVFSLLLIPMSKKMKNSRIGLFIDLILAIMAIISGISVFSSFLTNSQRVGLPPTMADVVIGLLSFIILFEVARRVVGWAFMLVTSAFPLKFQGELTRGLKN